MTGETISHYRILEKLGEGGMGAVYRATDTKLHRDVAIKILHDWPAVESDRLVRFSREAQILASLNHPNIASVYSVEDRAIVMELVEGPTLAERIVQGPLDIAEALPLAHQITDALIAAHDQGVIHRDLKPANIKISANGRVKLLDFGLATSTVNPSKPIGPNSPTEVALTRTGTIIGTAAYMSPEQAAGEPLDKRTDIWSFGVVLLEMITGRRPFGGNNISSTLASVMRDPIDWSPLPSDTPTHVRLLLRRCLERDKQKRLRDLGDAWIEIDEVHSSSSKRPVRWVAAAIVLGAVSAVSAWLGLGKLNEPQLGSPRLFKLNVLPPEKSPLNDQYSIPAVSPNGQRLAFVATTEGKEELWVRDLDSLAVRPLPGTAGAQYPFWSPDSQAIAFFADGKLKRTDLAGGPVLTLCDVGAGRGGTWSHKGVLVWGGFGTGIYSVPAAGGRATAVTSPSKRAGGVDHRFPWFLPDGRHFLYTDTTSNVEESGVYVADIQSDYRERLVAITSNAAYSPPGYLLFVRDGALMAQPFDAALRRITGEAVPIADKVDSQATRAQNQFSISLNGVLAYSSGRSGGGSLLTWFDRSGKVTGALGAPNALSWGAISPDDKIVAVQRLDQGLMDIWQHDLTRGIASRFTFGPGGNGYPAWTRDGRHVSFVSVRQGVGRPFRRATSGSAQDEILSTPLGEPPSSTNVEDWSPDGKYAVLRVVNPKTLYDIWVLPFDQGKPGIGKPYLLTEFGEVYARVSPDGHWLAYTSNESKRNEIYVQSFPALGNKIKVSRDGGERSIWSRNGKELYFVSPDEKMMAVSVKTGPRFESGVPKALFNVRLSRAMDAWFDVTKDGRFLVPVQVDQTMNVPMIVVVNWQAGLKR
jgi:eukaryotic-like serine/threonine-protein kinase